jgi:hypothetical protein
MSPLERQSGAEKISPLVLAASDFGIEVGNVLAVFPCENNERIVSCEGTKRPNARSGCCDPEVPKRGPHWVDSRNLSVRRLKVGVFCDSEMAAFQETIQKFAKFRTSVDLFTFMGRRDRIEDLTRYKKGSDSVFACEAGLQTDKLFRCFKPGNIILY